MTLQFERQGNFPALLMERSGSVLSARTIHLKISWNSVWFDMNEHISVLLLNMPSIISLTVRKVHPRLLGQFVNILVEPQMTGGIR